MKMKMETLKSEVAGEGSGEGSSSEHSQSFSSASSTGDLGEKNIRKTWLGRILAARNIPDQLIALCEAQLVEKEGYGTCETFARSPPEVLNRAYLQSLGITGQGVLQEFLNLHGELHDEWLTEESCRRDFFEGTRNAKDDQSGEDGAQKAADANETQSAQQVNLNTIPATTATTIARSYLSTAAPTCLRDVPQTTICRVVWFGVMVVCILACETMPFPVPLLSIVVLTGMVVRSPDESDTTLPMIVSTIVSPTLITLTTTCCKYLLQWTAVRIVLCFVFLCAAVDESVPLVLRVGAVCALLGLVLSAPADSIPEAGDCAGAGAEGSVGTGDGEGNSAVVGSDVGTGASASASVQQRDESDQRCSFGHGGGGEDRQTAGGGCGRGGADDRAPADTTSTPPGSSTSGTTSLSTTLDATHDTVATTTNTADNNTTDNTTPTADTTTANPLTTSSTTTTSKPMPEQPVSTTSLTTSLIITDTTSHATTDTTSHATTDTTSHATTDTTSHATTDTTSHATTDTTPTAVPVPTTCGAAECVVLAVGIYILFLPLDSVVRVFVSLCTLGLLVKMQVVRERGVEVGKGGAGSDRGSVDTSVDTTVDTITPTTGILLPATTDADSTGSATTGPTTSPTAA